MLIGLVGRKESGKTFIAKTIATEVSSYNFKVLSFSSPLKSLVVESGELTHKQVSAKRKSRRTRRVLQNIGTGIIRSVDANFFTRRMHDIIHASTTSNIIVDDVRFLNEALIIKHNGGTLIRVVRPIDLRTRVLNMILGKERAHVSEIEMSRISCDMTIYNIGDEQDIVSFFYDFVLPNNIKRRFSDDKN